MNTYLVTYFDTREEKPRRELFDNKEDALVFIKEYTKSEYLFAFRLWSLVEDWSRL